MVTQQDVIKKFMKSLDTTTKTGVKALDAAIKAGSNSAFSSFNELKQAMINDCKNAKSADDFLKTYCGIDYSTKDNGAITGSDAGGSTTKTDESVIPESGSLKTYKKTSFTKKGLTVKLGDGKTYKKLSDSEKFIWNGLYTWWIEGALNLIEESYGTNFGFGSSSSATVKEISVSFYKEKSDTLAQTSSDFDDDGKTYKTTLYINMYNWDSLKDNLVQANLEFDHTIAHELTHAVMHVNMNGYSYKSLLGFVKEGLAELTCGVENKWSTGTYSLKNLVANSSSLDSALNVNNTGTLEKEMYSGGYMFLRYFARQSSDFTIENKTSNTTVQTFRGNDSIKSVASKVLIDSGMGNDTVSNDWNSSTKYVTVLSGAGDDVILSDSANSKLDGGTGNDSIRNWNDNVKIYGGTGDDSITNDNFYNGGNKVTIDGGTGNDRIISWGNNVNIVGGTGDDTIKNGTGTDSDDAGGSKVTINGGSGADLIINWGGAALLSGGTGEDTIFGDAGNDKIYGGANNDSLWGDAGNDSLWGGNGNDVFIYTVNEGTDKIFDYEKDDMLKILKADGSNGSFKSSKYSGGDLTLTINGGGKIIFDDVSSSMNFNINGTTYKISSSKLVKK